MCALLVLDMTMRVYRGDFLAGPERTSNVFEFVLVLLQSVDQLLALTISNTGEYSDYSTGATLFRVLRIFKCFRILRVFRYMVNLSSLLYLISGSLSSFAWAILLLLSTVYVFAVFLIHLPGG